MKKYLFILLIIPLFFISCNDESDEPEIEPKQELPDISVVDISQESDWDYWVVGKKDYYYIKKNSSSSLPESVLYHSSEINKDFSIFFNDDGLVDKVVLDNHIFIFRNFNGHFVDIGVVNPNGEIEIFRDVETPNYNWETLIFNKSNSLKDFRSELIRWTGHAIAGVPCALSLAALPATFGASTVVAAVSCTSFAARLTGDILENDFNIHTGINEFIETYEVFNTIASCASLEAFDCVHGTISFAYDVYFDDYQVLENSNDDIQIIENELSISSFQSELQNLDDNKVPDGWEFKAIRTAYIGNGRINVETNDGGASLYKNGYVSNSTNEIILEMDAYIAYSYWGLISYFQIHSGDKLLQFRTGEEDYDHPVNNIANDVLYREGGNNYIYVHESLSPTVTGKYHLTLTMNDLGYEFFGIDPNSSESFRIFINPDNYFNFNEIDKIQFSTVAQTNNNGWIDNIRVTVN